jgi:DNA-binding HxlR family transcriptional regulator
MLSFIVYKRNYLSHRENYCKVSVNLETNRQRINHLPVIKDGCSFEGYDAAILMKETSKIRRLITRRGTLEMLIPLCCSTRPVRHKQFRQLLKGISSKTLATRLKELEEGGILERQAYNEIPPRVEYKLTKKGQELVESIINLLQWMQKWGKSRQ